MFCSTQNRAVDTGTSSNRIITSHSEILHGSKPGQEDDDPREIEDSLSISIMQRISKQKRDIKHVFFEIPFILFFKLGLRQSEAAVRIVICLLYGGFKMKEVFNKHAFLPSANLINSIRALIILQVIRKHMQQSFYLYGGFKFDR